jgi:chromate reductase
VVFIAVVTLSRRNGASALFDINRVLSYMGNCVLYQPEIVLAPAPSLLRVREDTVELTDDASRELVTLALEHFGSIIRAGTASTSAALFETRHTVIERARFAPLIREAIMRGVQHEAIENRLHNAGMDVTTARDWIVGELAAAQSNSRSASNGGRS